MTRTKYSLLAIDGGGIRGVIPARVLEAIENRLARPVCELFDMVAGTSTGGILALGVSKPGPDPAKPAFTAAQLLGLYVDHGHEIFPQSLWRKVRTVGGVLDVRYPTTPLEQLLRDRFGETMLSTALTEVVIPTYDLSLPGPFFFKRRYTLEDPNWDVKMWDAARATSAAPTYFEPARVPSLKDGVEHALVDGGVFANNPAVAAYSDAIRTGWGKDAQIDVVSIGTGQPPMDKGHPGPIPVAYKDALHWGFLSWARPGLDVVFDGVAKAAEYEMDKLCDHDQALNYWRLQSDLPTAGHGLDDASPENIKKLQDDAETLLVKDSAKLDEICAKLEEVAADRTAAVPVPTGP
jgi:Patatin-like phospholipase